MTVIGIFGPTASGKTRVAAALAERFPAELVSADAMQVYRGLPILTNQSTRRGSSAIWPLDHEASVGEYAPLAHAAIDEILAAGQDADRRRRHGPLPPRGARRPRAAAGACPGRARALGALYDEDPGARPRAARRSSIPAAAAAVHGTTAAASCARSSSPRPARRSRRRRTGSGRRRRGTRRVLVGLDVPKDVLERRIEERRARCSTPASSTRCARRSPGRSRRPRGRRSASTRWRRCRARRRSRRSSCARAATPRISASGCGASPASLWSMRIARRARSPMTSSRWHAHGNIYLVS